MNNQHSRILRSLLISLLACIIHISTAQENTVPFYRCLPGDYLNSPTFHQLAKQGNYKYRMDNFLDSEISFTGGVSIINGKVDHIYLENNVGRWRENSFPEEWEIKIPYKAMAATDKNFPKPRDFDIFESIHIRKEIDSVELNLTYGVSYLEEPNDWQEKWEQNLNKVYISGKAAYNKGCTLCDPPPPIWKTFIGEEGGQLCKWLCKNMGKALPPGFLENNFVPITYMKRVQAKSGTR